MLSKTEREYLSGNYNPSKTHKLFQNHKIKKKLKEFYQLELPLIQNSSVSDFANVVSEFTNAEMRSRDSKDERALVMKRKSGPDRIRTDDLTLRKRSHYPSYATSPQQERTIKFLKTFGIEKKLCFFFCGFNIDVIHQDSGDNSTKYWCRPIKPMEFPESRY